MYAVTGGTGFLGQHLVQRITDKGARAKVAARSPPKKASWDPSKVAFENVSVLEKTRLAPFFEGCDGVYHLAGIVEHSKKDAPRMLEVNVQGTLNVLEAAAEAGVRRVVYASTSGTVACTRDGSQLPATDASPYAREATERWPYYASKIQAEEAALAAAARLGVELVCMRPTLLLGPGDARLSSCRSVYDLLLRKVPFLPGGGLSFVDVRDVADAFVAAMDKAQPSPTYLLGSANMTMDEYFKMVEAASGVPAPWVPMPGWAAVLGARAINVTLGLFGKHDPTFDPVYVQMGQVFWYLDAARARQELGFAPRLPAETVRDTVQWLRAHMDELKTSAT